ncbi:MAG: UDP-N-acetylmuramate dehydrogenase [Bacteroidetes bacterium]|nr:UDP-N-acetylmuramate dehydrogenase [Bacteroidota bacterium]
MEIKSNINLKPFNTFGIDCWCNYFVQIKTLEELSQLRQNAIFNSNEKLIIGGGSNILFTKNFKGLVIKNEIKGIKIISENDETVIVEAGAGEVWHEFVMWNISKGFSGLENLSLIPGCVGAAPMQNIGAYGVEIKDTFYSLKAIDINSGIEKIFYAKDCNFGYRESVFKSVYKNKYCIVAVSFQLSKQSAVLNTSYGAINDELNKMGIEIPNIKNISDAVISIRNSKLPNPKIIGNAGSFFKNPEVSPEKYNTLKQNFEKIVSYPLTNGNYKLAAGWLIEHCNLKGYSYKNAAVHDKQALVLINKGAASGNDIYELSEYILNKVFEKFKVKLEREVNII